MRAFVTGATGQLGSYLVRDLLSRGHKVAVLLRDPSNAWRISSVLDSCEVIVGKIESITQIQSSLTAWKPDVCFHLAWFGVTAEFRNDPRQVSVNGKGSLELLEVLANAGCKSFIGVGSQAEYGIVDGILFEHLPLAPVTAYGVTKHSVRLLSEKFCELAGIRHVWFRLLATYGPGDNEDHLIPFVLRKLLAGNRPSLTPAEQKWDYLYVSDAARALLLAAENDAVQGIMNLGCGDARSVRWIVESLRDWIDPQLPLGVGDIPYRHDQVMFLQADIQQVSSKLGWKPEISWEEGISKTAKWYKENPVENRSLR